MKNKTKTEIRGAAPGLHSEGSLRWSNERRNRRGALALLGVLTVGALLHGVDPESAENQPRVTAEDTAEANSTQAELWRLIESGGVTHGSVYVLRPGVRLYDTPEKVIPSNGKDSAGNIIPTVEEPLIIVRGVFVENEAFIAVPTDEGIRFASTDAESEILEREGSRPVPYAEEFMLATSDELIDNSAGISEVIAVRGGEPALQARLTDFDIAKS